jgi:glycerol-3-phosphate dehydrogenase
LNGGDADRRIDGEGRLPHRKPMQGPVHDLAVIGGGINGCGIARDAQGRGLSVFLAEMGDLGGATSSASTKLIHGGLRYLELYAFSLVREALAEREVLLRSAPHIVWPLRFVLPHHRGQRPWPVVRAGLFLYDHLGGRHLLPPTRSLDLGHDPAGEVLKEAYRRAFEYSDCWVEDSRLVVLNARDASDRGADIRSRTRCTAARRDGGLWRLTLEDRRDGRRFEIAARALVNAGGPWVSSVISEVAAVRSPTRTRLVKGSHIVVARAFPGDRAFIFQNADGRVCFAIPYEHDFTLIGTTDEDYDGDPAAATVSQGEIDYLLGAVGGYLRRPVTPEMIRWTFAGVRPLIDDGATQAKDATREYALELDGQPGEAPLLNVFGGKITTFRRLAEAAMAQLAASFPGMGGAWTRTARLPGGDIDVTAFDTWAGEMAARYAWLEAGHVRRLCRAYGTAVGDLLAGASRPADLGRDFGAGLTEREVAYLVRREWAETADDVLWRRSKLGLRFTGEQAAALSDYLETARRPAATGAKRVGVGAGVGTDGER